MEINLRALTNKDIPLTLKWNNQDEIKNQYAGHPFPVNLEMETEWYDRITKSNIPTTVFGIEHVDSQKLIGISLLKNINLIHRKAEFAIYIGDKEERGKGYSTVAAQQTIDFGFQHLGLNRIYLEVQSSNLAAIKLYERLGFKREGLIRQAQFKNGKFLDEIIMGILKEDTK